VFDALKELWEELSGDARELWSGFLAVLRDLEKKLDDPPGDD